MNDAGLLPYWSIFEITEPRRRRRVRRRPGIREEGSWRGTPTGTERNHEVASQSAGRVVRDAAISPAATCDQQIGKGQRVCLDPRKSGRKSRIGHCSIFYLFVVNIVLL